MQITQEILPKIENHFGIKLSDLHKEMLLTDWSKRPVYASGGGRIHGKMFVFSLLNAFYNGENIEIDCITNEHAKEVYQKCLNFANLLNKDR